MNAMSSRCGHGTFYNGTPCPWCEALNDAHVAVDRRELRSVTMRMIATELESGSDRAMRLSEGKPGTAHWLRTWAQDLAPMPEDDGEVAS